MTQPFILAACAEMLWQDKPIDWRCARLAEMGFQVGLWHWQPHDLAKLESTGATFTIINGYLRGRLADDEGAEELLATARETVHACKRLGIQRYNLHGTGLDSRGHAETPSESGSGAMWLKAKETLKTRRRHGRGGRRGLHARKPQPGGRPSRRALRARWGHDRAGLFDRQSAAAAQPRPLPRPDRRGEPDRALPQGACPGSARSRWPTYRAAANRAPAR